MHIQFHRNFKKAYKKLPVRVQKQCDARIVLFMEDEYHPVLRNHVLAGKYRDYRSIDITGDVRALYQQIDETTALFVIVGTHSMLYS